MSISADYEASRQAARQGDPLAHAAMGDAWQDAEPGALSPYVTGQCYFFQTTTLYYIGRIRRQGPGWVIIDEASWVHWTGRLSVFCKYGFDMKQYPEHSRRRPRSEYVGDGRIVHVGSNGAIGHPWPHPLPRESQS